MTISVQISLSSGLTGHGHGCSAFVIVAWMACNLDQEFGSATATTDPVELRIASGEFYNSQ